VVQVYAARAVSWRGAFSVHCWIVVKPADAPGYTRYDVVGFGVGSGAPAIRVNRTGPRQLLVRRKARVAARSTRRLALTI